ncbi:MAG: winged helix-turn-helix domain-containing protein [Candidatus Bathyarchaeota archaeon]|nr:winged helix-turn-helix domain-containing protein [Candidatus Bathyarchaeota archaeon]
MERFCNEAYYKLFQTLASQTRLAIIDVLRNGTKTANEISEVVNLSLPTTVENLKPLISCVLIHSEGSGEQKRYSLNLEIIEPLGNILAFHADKYCPGLQECIPEEKLKEYMKQEAAKETYIEHE